MSIQNALASVAVNDIESAVRWYERLLQRPCDSRPMPLVAEWKFDRGGWLQVYQLAQRAGQGSVTLSVDDIESQADQLERSGIGAGERTTQPLVKTLMITDPDGNHIAFAEPIAAGMAR